MNVNKIHFILNFLGIRKILLNLIETFLLKILIIRLIKKNKILLKNRINNKIPEYDDQITLLIKNYFKQFYQNK